MALHLLLSSAVHAFILPEPALLLQAGPTALIASAAPGTVVAPNWLLPTAATLAAAIPATLIPFIKNGEKARKNWETEAETPIESYSATHPDAFCVLDAGAKGAGLFATEHIPKGTYLFDYEGELLTKSEYDARYPDQVSDYAAAYRQTSDGAMKFVDAARAEAIARFMNHDGRRPNVGRRTFCVYDECRIMMYALRDIRPGDELQWNYGEGYWAARDGLVDDDE